MQGRKPKPEWKKTTAACFAGADYTDDESEFLRAVSRWQGKHPGKRPTWRDVLVIIKELGWKLG